MELKRPPLQIKNIESFDLVSLKEYELSPIGYSNYGIIRIEDSLQEYICTVVNNEVVLLKEVSILNNSKMVFQFSDVDLDMCMPWCVHHGIEWYFYDKGDSLYVVKVHHQVIEERNICSLDDLKYNK